MQITHQEAWSERGGDVEVIVPDYLKTAIEEVAFQARASELIDQSSGVSARMTISLYESVLSNAERRGLLAGEKVVVARVADLFASISAVTGKVELVYEGEREGPQTVALKVMGEAVHAVFEARLGDALKPATPGGEDSEIQPVLGWFGGGRTLDLA